MNKIYCRFALIHLLLIGSCASDNMQASFQLPSEIYTIDKAYDIANSNSAADLRLEISVRSDINVSDLNDVRLVVTKATKTFAPDQISGLSSGNFFSMTISSNTKQVLKPTSFKDADGDAIVNGVGYKVYVAVIGKGDTKQLSMPKDLTLADKPIYSGDYVGSWEDLGPPGPGSFPVTLRIKDNYSCQLFYTENFVPYGKSPSTEDVTATLTVTGTTFSFNANQLIEKYVGGGAFTTGNNGGCAASKVLTGAIEDDTHLIFDTFKWSDCDGSRNVNLRFTRQ